MRRLCSAAAAAAPAAPTAKAGPIDFGNGQPHPSELPHAAVQRAASSLFASAPEEGSSGWLEYGDYCANFKTTLAAFLTRGYRLPRPMDPDRLWPTAGISHALSQACGVLARSGDVVLAEDPTYFLSLNVFREHGLHVESVACDADGMRPDALAAAAAAARAGGRRPSLAYCVPTFGNPGGRTMPEERRRAIVSACGNEGVTLLADEVYHLLYWGAPPPPPMASYGDCVVSLGSFAKILAPGLRVGWVEAKPSLTHRFGEGASIVQSGGIVSHFSSQVVMHAVRQGAVDEHVAELRGRYGARCRALCAALRAALPDGCTFDEPEGGYFVWIRLPEGADAEELLAAAGEEVRFQPGVKFSASGGSRNCLRLCFARAPEAELADGARRLGRAIEALLPRWRDAGRRGARL